jgi:hypothetical protein
MISDRSCGPILTKTGLYRQHLVKLTSISFNENAFSDSRRMDRPVEKHNEGKRRT